jgi:hypothetical protein
MIYKIKLGINKPLEVANRLKVTDGILVTRDGLLQLEPFYIYNVLEKETELRIGTCTRDLDESGILVKGNFYQNEEVCKRCKNFLHCLVNGTTSTFILDEDSIK